MKVLFLTRRSLENPAPFVVEQIQALERNYPIEILRFTVKKGGIIGYLKTVFSLNKFFKNNQIDIIHAHYGLTGMVAVLYKLLFFSKIKVVITYHGSDINNPKEKIISLLAGYLADAKIIISTKMISTFNKKTYLIPCGIDIPNIESKYNTEDLEKEFKLSKENLLVLFNSDFGKKVKDPAFAKQVIIEFNKQNKIQAVLIELKNYNRQQVNRLMNLADVLFMCSKTEGSPQSIKEAISNRLPILTNQVGDVEYICENIDHCYIVEKNIKAYINVLNNIANKKERIIDNSSVLRKFDNKLIATKIYEVYKSISNK
ncbi:MAG: glycosyltransferase [Chitinophagales bacterium]